MTVKRVITEETKVIVINAYYKGESSVSIARQTGLDYKRVSEIINESFVHPSEIEKKLTQIQQIELKLFALIEQEKETGVKNKAIDELKMSYCKFLINSSFTSSK